MSQNKIVHNLFLINLIQIQIHPYFATHFVMPQSGSQTHDNYRMPLSETQIPGTPSKDLQGTTDNHHPLKITMYIIIILIKIT